MSTAVPISTAVPSGPASAATDESTTAEPGFGELGLPDALVAALAKKSITVPSPIQARAIPDALAGTHVLGRAQTGSGKTLAFGLPMLTRLSDESRPSAKRPRALVLVPTRELAFQVVDSLSPYADAVGVTVRPAVGGTPFGKQADQLRRGVDILVATPGRLGDHLRQGTCVLDEIEITALDEADQMADMGFLPEVRAILGDTPDSSQRLLFSATLDREVQSLVRQFLPDHVQHSTEDGRASVSTMEHYVLLVDRGQKDAVLAEIASRDGGRTIMFARTKLGCEGITDRLRALGVAAESLHGGKAQNQRTRVLDRFKTGRTPVLVATDVAARGIHVDGIDLVVHVDPPADHKDYLHRAGRTARAGQKGAVAAIVLPNQRRMFKRLTDTAGVSATAVRVTPGSAELTEITGAKTPSGVPVRPERNERSDRPRSDRPFRGGPPSSRGGRPGGERRPQGDRRQDSDRRPYGDRPRRSSDGERGSSEWRGSDRNGGGFRPRQDGGGRRDDHRRDDTRGYREDARGHRGDRPAAGGERRSYGARTDRPRQERSDSRSYESRPRESRPAESRSYGSRTNGARPAESRSNEYGRRERPSSGGFRSRTAQRSYDGFDGPRRDRNR
ncbi:DEAD/DEAH box helicase [Rhodococcus triatomae]|uniref:Superfamily II DNA and RNA helicase n=1 Tax=Rhodococcus triatomae TaxID=300028 RepID=A0A1G8K7T6_9NOCA|nr:DEAD/DEAH box helicase [Rhodococcus triatomae]QNG18834.1 DEAD/DEAH box helicase [Rhodococcus triatomae]QNG25255.1 DEAD/DEAH box helicase [Rhodococcus triatomae]SDI38870.1 Superfamily II DNA and RNA helicase [Rhodococcus triatomae]